MSKGTIYPSIEEFRLAIAQYSIKHEFEYVIDKSEPDRFRAHCPKKGCKWRIHASHSADRKSIEVKVHVAEHECASARRDEKVKRASKAWICEKVMEWVKENSSIRPAELQRRIKEHHKIFIHYKRVWTGKELALKRLFGDWDSSFDKLYSWKGEIEKRYLGSIVSIDHMTFKEKRRFTRMFVALKPCIDGFIAGCK